MSIEIRTAEETDAKAAETDAKIAAADEKAIATDAKAVATDAKAVETDAKITALGAKIDALTQPIDPPPPPPIEPLPAAAQRFVQMTDSATDGLTHSYANNVLKVSWTRKGGDYLDANDVLNGPTPMATIDITSTAIRRKQCDVTTIVARMLKGPRTWKESGFYVTTLPGSIGSPTWTGREDTVVGQPAQLEVITSAGKFTPPLVADTHLDATSNKPLGALVRLRTPAIFQFDLSGIAGSVHSATFSAYYDGTGVAPKIKVGVFQLAMPRIITDPAREIGIFEPDGLAASVAKDSDLGSVALQYPAGPVLTYIPFDSDAQINAAFDNGVNRGPEGGATGKNWSNHAIGEGVFEIDQEMGVSLGRATIPTTNSIGCTARALAVLPYNRAPVKNYQRKFTDQGPQELFMRGLLRIDPDVPDGMNDLGVKLYGMDSNTTSLGAGYEAYQYDPESKFSLRFEHGAKSAAHPGLFTAVCYIYDKQHPNTLFPANGEIVYCNKHGHFCFEVGRTYSIEQRIKLNTQDDAGVWLANGIYEIWVDDVKLLSIPNRLIRADPLAQFQAIIFANLYHGGIKQPTKPIHYWYGAMCSSTKYIGPPRRLGT